MTDREIIKAAYAAGFWDEFDHLACTEAVLIAFAKAITDPKPQGD